MPGSAKSAEITERAVPGAAAGSSATRTCWPTATASTACTAAGSILMARSAAQTVASVCRAAAGVNSIRVMFRQPCSRLWCSTSAAHRDRGDMEHRIDVGGTVETPELAVRTVKLGVTVLVQVAFDDHLGVGGGRNAVGDPAHHRQGSAAQGCHQVELITGRRGGGEVGRGMRANGETDRKPLAPLDARPVGELQVGGRSEVGRQLLAAAQHHPPAADVVPPAGGIDGEVNRGGDVGAAVQIVLQVERQLREIDVITGQDDLVHGRVR